MNRITRSSLILACAGLVSCASTVPQQSAMAPRSSPPIPQPTQPTTLSGQVLDVNDQPLAGVTVIDQSVQTQTDTQGNFLLNNVPAGNAVLKVDGRKLASKGAGADYGFFHVRADVLANKANMVPFTIYLPLIDHAHDITVPSPTRKETDLTTPAIPGLKIRIPAGTVIRDSDNQIVTKLGLTEYPAGKMPYKLIPRLEAGPHFTVQPGGLCFYTKTGTPADVQIIFPNFKHELPHARATFFRYDLAHDFVAYGGGSISADGKRIVPDAGTVLHGLDAICPPPTAHSAVGGK